MRFLKLTRRGTPIPAHKSTTAHLATRPLDYRGEFVYPVQAHTGAPAEPLVAVGDRVEAGQKIAEAQGLISASSHSAVAGTVTAIEPRPTTQGEMLSIVIQAEATPGSPRAEATEVTRDEIVERVRDAGVVGMGGARFPTAVKLAPPSGVRYDTLILNGAECEPYITADLRTLLEESDLVLEGVRVLHMLHPSLRCTVLAVEQTHARELKGLRTRLEAEGVELKVLPAIYPQGAEKALIKNVTGREVPAGSLPSVTRCLVLNVATVAAIARAVSYREPLTERIVTVSGEGVGAPQNLRVKIGTPIRAVLEACDAATEGMRILCGGPMMGTQVLDLDSPIHKGSNGILALPEAALEPKPVTDCIHCGSCLNVCPISLQPILIANLSVQARVQDAVEMGAMDCIQCGSCSYICPAGIPLLDLIRDARNDHLAHEAAKKEN